MKVWNVTLEKKQKIALLVLGGVVLVLIAWFSIRSLSSRLPITKKSASTIICSLQEKREIDKFYTGKYLIPVLEESRGPLKRDMAKSVITGAWNLLAGKTSEEETRLVVKGYCLRMYEVSFGYDNLMQILENQDYLDAARSGNLAALPSPQILAVNGQKREIQGNYSGFCVAWDSNEALRKRIILKTMEEEGILQSVTQRGREYLANLLSAFYI